jgi:hypothetical protein
VVVVASGPTLPDLTDYVAKAHDNDWFIIAVQDAWRLVPYADMLYGCDAKWWAHHGPNLTFEGERWSTHDDVTNQKIERKNGANGEINFRAADYDLNLIEGRQLPAFSLENNCIHYGDNSGFQAVNIALHLGAKQIALIGFDHRVVSGKRHFFGDHPKGWGSGEFAGWMKKWEYGRRSLPEDVTVYNCTPNSALKVFEFRSPDVITSSQDIPRS